MQTHTSDAHRARAMLLLHCYEPHQMAQSQRTAIDHKTDVVAVLSFVMELLHSQQVLIPSNHPSSSSRTILTPTLSGQ